MSIITNLIFFSTRDNLTRPENFLVNRQLQGKSLLTKAKNKNAILKFRHKVIEGMN
jgi:hypothetical protein